MTEARRPTAVGVEDAPTTKVERFLAVLLAVFLFVGLLWTYAQPLDSTDDQPYFAPTTASEPAIVARDDARRALEEAMRQLDQARAEEQNARETYRTKLDAGQPATAEEAVYQAAQAETRRVEGLHKAAETRLAQVEPAGNAEERRLNARFDEGSKDRERTTFLLRFALVLGALAASYALFEVLRRRRSRYLLTGMSAVGAAAAMAVVMTGDYLDVRNTGPIVLSLVGTVLTIAALFGYERFLAHRLPARRVRKGECPFCGYPVGGGVHCEGCGRPVVAPCTTCTGPRRVGALHCGACGAP